jgi:hypothetical protein
VCRLLAGVNGRQGAGSGVFRAGSRRPPERVHLPNRRIVVRLLMRVPALATFGVAVVLTLMLAGSTPQFDVSPVPEPPADPSVVVLQLQEWRSLTPPYERAALPELTLHGGGRVIVPAFWDGSLQRAREYLLPPGRYRQIYRLAHRAGLARSAHLDQPVAATDGSLFVASLWSAGRMHTSTLVSPDSTDTGARGRIVDFRQHVRTLAAPADVTTVAAYRPTRLAVLATAGWRGPGDGIPEAPRPWPGPDLLAGARTPIGLCTILTGSAMATAEALGRNASLTTLWTSGGQQLTVALRPLLPDEHNCADLEGHLG